MDEAPQTGKAYGRRLKEWIDAYPKPVLDAFVAQVLDAAKRCEDAWAAIQVALRDYVREANADDKIYGRKNKAWVEVPTGGGGGGGAPRLAVIRAMEWNTLTSDMDVVMFLPPADGDVGQSHCTIELPAPTQSCVIKLSIGPEWWHDPKGQLGSEIRLRTSTDENSGDVTIVYSGGNGAEVRLGFKMEYTMVFFENNWYVTDAMPAQPR